jgi:hypothetical protein
VVREDPAREDAAAGVPPSASVVTQKGEAGLPGRGLFQLICALGLYDGPDGGTRGPGPACARAGLRP